jgi:acyl-coenzyme A synthetase/AMP-(fatty) acid ligase
VARGAALFYDTGDIAQLDQAGLLQFVGRDDGQVKIMGYRVELGEVEHALVRVTGAAQLMVEKVMLASGVEELVAVLPAAFASEKKRIRVELQKLLPTYMLPRRYVFTQNFPRNSNGKLDRNALRNQVLQSQSET